MAETCTISIKVAPPPDDEPYPRDIEDIVKNLWPAMIPLFTKRRGVSTGLITLNGHITVEWRYGEEE